MCLHSQRHRYIVAWNNLVRALMEREPFTILPICLILYLNIYEVLNKSKDSLISSSRILKMLIQNFKV